MEKTKEEIEILRKGTLNRYKHDTYNECLDIIDQKLQDYTFIRVPKKVKLSEIFEYLENKAKNDSLLQDDEGNLMWHLTYEVRKPTDGSYIQILEDCVEEPRNHIPSQ